MQHGGTHPLVYILPVQGVFLLQLQCWNLSGQAFVLNRQRCYLPVRPFVRFHSQQTADIGKPYGR